MSKDILDPNPFAKPLLAKTGDTEAHHIYRAVGYALHRWEGCEENFGVLYSSFIETGDGNHVLMRSFGTITSAATRHGMILHAAEAFFAFNKNDELKKQVRYLLKIYQKAAERRNEIAHSTVMGPSRHKVVNNKAVPLPTLWFLVPPLFATRKTEIHWDQPKYRYTTEEIGHFATCFEELGSRVLKTTQSVRAFRASIREK